MAQAPPQSTSASPADFLPSSQPEVTHLWVVAVQTPLAQSRPVWHVLPDAHFLEHVPPQSTSASPAESTLSEQLSATQTVPSQKPLEQSAPVLHPWYSVHFTWQAPPQSTSVSPDVSFTSAQVEATHLPLAEQAAILQSAVSLQLLPTSHALPSAEHGPPQSRSVSPPSFTRSRQMDATHFPGAQVLPSHAPLAQSLAALQAWPTPHFLAQPPPQSMPASPADFLRSRHASKPHTPSRHWAEAQSFGTLQLCPFWHFVVHLPPQSVAPSSGSFFPFRHLGAQIPPRQAPSVQSLLALQC